MEKWIIVQIVFVVVLKHANGVQSVEKDDQQGSPCNGLQNYFVGDDDVAVCAETWTGDISQASDICKENWHVCTWNDKDIIQKISWYEATHISGCYVINAAHGSGACSACSEKSPEDEMAAIGADCIRYNKTSDSCFGKGRIDASYTAIEQYTPCHYSPWMTGVLCCRDKIKGEKPEIIIQPGSNIDAKTGSRLVMKCKATGDPSPSYHWFNNGKLVHSGNDNYWIIPSLTEEDSGYWQCVAENGYGKSFSSKWRLRVTKATNEGIGCKDSRKGKMLNSANIAVCNGEWVGHVKKASKQICAPGWRVCSVEDRKELFFVSYKEALNLSGCYAYNAASSKYYSCEKCSPSNKNNRMSGIGNGCGYLVGTRSSCLSHGRIDVHPQPNENATERKLRSCKFNRDITTGVACCKNTKNVKKFIKKRKDENTSKPCRCKKGDCRRACKCLRGHRRKRCQRLALLQRYTNKKF